MDREQEKSVEHVGPMTSASAWGLRHAGLAMGKDSQNQVVEFTGMWALKPDADLVALTRSLAPGGWINPPGESFTSGSS